MRGHATGLPFRGSLAWRLFPVRGHVPGTASSVRREKYGSPGVHAASVAVDGPVAPGTDFGPDDIAEHGRPHTQPCHLWAVRRRMPAAPDGARPVARAMGRVRRRSAPAAAASPACATASLESSPGRTAGACWAAAATTAGSG